MTALPKARGPRRPPEAEMPPMMDLGDEDFWQPPTNLAAPEPLPGMVQRWIRTGIRGEDDVSNLYRMRQIGWIPRPADTVKGDFAPPTIKHGELAGCIGVHNMVLMHMPAELARRIQSRNDMMTRRQTESVDRDIMKVQNKQVQFTQERQLSLRGMRRKPSIMDDD